MVNKSGRKPKVDPSIVDEEILKNKNEIFDGKSIVGVNAEVWRKIASKLSEGIEDVVTPGSIRIRITRNGGNILNILGILPVKKTDIDPSQSLKNHKIATTTYYDSYSDDENDEQVNNQKLVFDVTFSVDEWKLIQPRETLRYEKRGYRTYNILTPYKWSNVIQQHFFLHTRLPCCLTFKKRPAVSFSGIAFLTVQGQCSECSSSFQGTIDSVPAVDTRVVMKCIYIGNFHGKHFKNRRLMGLEKECALNAMLTKRMDPSVYTRNQANVLMKEDLEASTSVNVDTMLLTLIKQNFAKAN